jgi:hypothetical protein
MKPRTMAAPVPSLMLVKTRTMVPTNVSNVVIKLNCPVFFCTPPWSFQHTSIAILLALSCPFHCSVTHPQAQACLLVGTGPELPVLWEVHWRSVRITEALMAVSAAW